MAFCKAAALFLLVALVTAAPARARSLAQAADDSATNATNPYTTNLSNRTAVVEAPIGSGTAIVRAIDSTVLPGLASSGLSIHQVTLPACTGLAPHYHPTADELQYVLTGTLKFVITDIEDNTFTGEASKGDINIIPKGLVHYVANEGCEDAVVNLVFSGNVTRVNLAPAMMLLGQPMAKDALGLANGTALDAPMGDIITITSSGCPDKCKSSSK